jgi:hypothetical protein
MSPDDLGKYITNNWNGICKKLASFAPYVQVAFEKIDAGEAICGYKSKKKFCEEVLGRTYNAVKFMLLGGNARNNVARKPRLTELEHKLLGTAISVHEALVDIRAGHIEQAVTKLQEKLPTHARIQKYLQRGLKPTVLNPDGNAMLPGTGDNENADQTDNFYVSTCIRFVGAMLRPLESDSPRYQRVTRLISREILQIIEKDVHSRESDLAS